MQTYEVFFKEMVSKIKSKSIKLFLRKLPLNFGGSTEEPKRFDLERLTLIGHRPMMEKLMNTEYEQNPSNRSGASEAHINTDRRQ
jgi:phosphohistidine phosphatase SixA